MRKVELAVDADFPGGNIVVESIRGPAVDVRPDLRDTAGDWFYWCFRLRDAGGRTVVVRFAGSNVIGVRGPAVSVDGGWTWNWLGASAVEGQTFRYTVPDGVGDVRFSFGMPYQEAQLCAFLEAHAKNPFLETGSLCMSEKGRRVERLRLGRLDGGARHRVVLTCRHHCCEMMASYALEGLLDTVLTDPDDGAWLREQVEFLVIPFVDKDGVEQGDQGKNRIPRDHNRDYAGESRYAATRAIRERVPCWAGGNLRFALDLHCPWIRGKRNECIYFVGGPDADNWARVGAFCKILADVQTGPLVFDPRDNLPYGVDWNQSDNYEQGKGFGQWSAELPGIRVGTSLELPYANANGGEVNAESARAFGHDLARAIGCYLRELT